MQGAEKDSEEDYRRDSRCCGLVLVGASAGRAGIFVPKANGFGDVVEVIAAGLLFPFMVLVLLGLLFVDLVSMKVPPMVLLLVLYGGALGILRAGE